MLSDYDPERQRARVRVGVGLLAGGRACVVQQVDDADPVVVEGPFDDEATAQAAANTRLARLREVLGLAEAQASTNLTPELLAKRAQRTLSSMRRKAMASPVEGIDTAPDAARFGWITSALTERGRPTRILLTYDVGALAWGWWPNHDHDQCFHLSVSHPTLVDVEEPSRAEVEAWCRAAFPYGAHVWTYHEPLLEGHPRRPHPGVQHLRLFVDRKGHVAHPTGDPVHLVRYFDGEDVGG